ncbi:MAG: TIGR03118 family protein [Methylomonas sp.]|jgi:uncharacterized protein (TIGR03118 family)
MNTPKFSPLKSKLASAAPLIAIAVMASRSAIAQPDFNQTNLITNNPSVNPAQITDPNLVNAWGISYSPTSPFWISDNGAGVATLYSVNPATDVTAKVALTVSIPGDGSVTGQVFNGNSADFGGDKFIFANEDGTISGWNGGTSAQVLQAGGGGNVYKGITEATLASGNSYLYAANFGTGAIDVIKGSASAPSLTGNFTDPNLPSGYSPFNVQNINGDIFVTYAQHTPGSIDEVDGLGKGFVDEFDAQGNFLGRIGSGGALDAPWGLAIAPSSFGAYAGDLLVGNFGSGAIDIFSLTGNYIGQLSGVNGQPLIIDGLWGLSVGNNGSAGNSQTLYFTAGPEGETNGLFGAITPVPEPAIIWMFATALAGWRLFGGRKPLAAVV